MAVAYEKFLLNVRGCECRKINRVKIIKKKKSLDDEDEEKHIEF